MKQEKELSFNYQNLVTDETKEDVRELEDIILEAREQFDNPKFSFFLATLTVLIRQGITGEDTSNFEDAILEELQNLIGN